MFQKKVLRQSLDYGGWVEVLDKELNVIEVYGHNKKVTKNILKMKYLLLHPIL